MKRLLLGFGLLLGACGNDDGGPVLDIGTGAQCAEPRFSDLYPILSSPKCASAGCHAASGSAGQLDLTATSTADLYARLVGAATNDAEGALQFPLRVEAGSSTTSYLLHMVEALVPLGSNSGRMPPGGSLEPCEIDALRTWIDDGAPPN